MFHGALFILCVSLFSFSAHAGTITPLPFDPNAKTYKLDYSGNSLILTDGPGLGSRYPGSFRGSILIDGRAYDGSLSGKTIEIEGIRDPFAPPDGERLIKGKGLISWGLSIPLYSTVGTRAKISFDDKSRVTSWQIVAGDGPPDYVSTSLGDSWQVFDTTYKAPPGTWRVSVIPVPASLPLLLLGCLALGGFVTRQPVQ